MQPDYVPADFGVVNTRTVPNRYFRNKLMTSGSKGKKSTMICLERTAEELKKSRVFWWRMLAVVSAILLLKIGSMSSKDWKVVARDMQANVISQTGNFIDKENLDNLGDSIGDSAVNSDTDRQPVEVSRNFDASSVAKKVIEEDEDIKITKRKTEKREASRRTDEFCKKIMKNPIPFDKVCKRVGANMTCVNGKTMMFSQFGQDYYLYKEHFKHLKRTGTYMDVASNDAVGISNSYFFDRCLGWRGICVEGNPYYFERIFRLRTCTLVPTCVGKNDGQTVDFGLAGGAGGIMGETNKHMQVWAQQRKEVHTIRERCTTMKNVMDREEMFEVDYLSLDVEGHEMQVLQGIDWERTKINVITVEVSRQSGPEIEKYMLEHNFKRHEATMNDRNDMIGSDVVYLHEDVDWGKPV